jgi:mannose-6-phosphate isomerase-like protein (cupin superfamily)
VEAEDPPVALKIEMVTVVAGSVVATPLIVVKDAGIVVTAPLTIVKDVGFVVREEVTEIWVVLAGAVTVVGDTIVTRAEL